jgi:hypothetical protein
MCGARLKVAKLIGDIGAIKKVDHDFLSQIKIITSTNEQLSQRTD